jgi:hypothetical protein
MNIDYWILSGGFDRRILVVPCTFVSVTVDKFRFALL